MRVVAGTARTIRYLAAAFAAIVAVSCASARLSPFPTVTPVGVRFVLDRPGARGVALAGTFNRWSVSSHPLSRDAGGWWSVVVPLPPGEHHFMFVVDGTEWTTPPFADEYADDGFGAKNGVVVVRGSVGI